MTRREEAAAILEQIGACAPRDLFAKMDELHKGTGLLLGLLDHADGVVYAGDIARRMNVSTARIAVILNKLEKNGFIQRQAAATDARKTVVKLTGPGRAWSQKTKDQMLDRTELLLERVGSEDIQEFIRISRKIKAALEEVSPARDQQ